MPPSIHPVDLIIALREKHLTPAIVFLTSRRACDEAMQAFDHSHILLPPPRQQAIATVLEKVIAQYPSIAEHPLIPTVQRIGVAAHHAGHLPSWKIAVEELMRHGCLDAVFATTTLAAGVDFPARTVIITQSSIRKSRDFMDLTIGEVQQIAGRAGRRGKDLVGFAIVTPSPYIDLNVLTKGFTGHPEAINSQFLISYPMVLNLLKAHALDQIQPILAKSFAQIVQLAFQNLGAIRWTRSGHASAPTGSQNGRPSTRSAGRNRTAPPSGGMNHQNSPHAFTFSPPVAWWASPVDGAWSCGNIGAKDRRAR